MPSYTVTEPQPHIPVNAYTHTGRGGAGNTFRVSPSAATTSAASTKSSSASTSSSTRRFYSGRGGAGNVHAASERVALSFADEYAAAQRREQTHGHVGRGGAGNVYSGSDDAASQASSRRDSSSTTGSGSGSVRSGFWARLSGQH